MQKSESCIQEKVRLQKNRYINNYVLPWAKDGMLERCWYTINKELSEVPNLCGSLGCKLY